METHLKYFDLQGLLVVVICYQMSRRCENIVSASSAKWAQEAIVLNNL